MWSTKYFLLPFKEILRSLGPGLIPGMNPKAAATGRPAAASFVVECVENCDAVLFNA